MNALTEPLINMLSLVVAALCLILLFNRSRRKAGLPEISVEKITEIVTREAMSALSVAAPEEAQQVKPREGADVPKALQEALIIYFNQLHASHVILRILAKQFDPNPVRFPHLAKAVRNEIEVKQLDDIPETAMRIALRMMVGANLVNESEASFKLTNLGKQLQTEIDMRTV